MASNPFGLNGLNTEQVLTSRRDHGSNRTTWHERNPIWESIRGIVTEPMFLLLLSAAAIYFILRETPEAIFMTVAILIVSAISFFQDHRSRVAMQALQQLTAPRAKVIRSGEVIDIDAVDIVIGDLIVAEEGHLVPADGRIIQSADFSLNESMLTGESFSVFRTANDESPFAWQGTQVVSGQAVLEAVAIGNETKLGRISGSLLRIEDEKTPLQVQIDRFVKRMASLGLVVFALVWLINYLQSAGDPQRLANSLLKGLTLAMSILPEEIPVAFSTFMALGAFRLMKIGIIAKNTRTVETLGASTVICVDKTGTITENRMSLDRVLIGRDGEITNRDGFGKDPEFQELIRTAMFASETMPFDPMEKEIHEVYAYSTPRDERRSYHMVHEYPLEGKPPMMTHIFTSDDGDRIVAAKGAPEAVLACCDLPEDSLKRVLSMAARLSEEGFRILAVGRGRGVFVEDNVHAYPKSQQDIPMDFLGLLAFFDPPKKGIRQVFQAFTEAGIRLKVITGDSPQTTLAIARQAGFPGDGAGVNGDKLLQMDDRTLKDHVLTHGLFTRMFPEAKLRIIEALKSQGEIVAMTGDGVNDAPALKAAHIGIAMGHRGSELAKSTASLIITDDDLGRMVDAVAMGRRIYANLKKAIQYIISIHIPIILTVFLPLVLGWAYPNIFSPVHVIFLELIMGPTCSIIYENEPLERLSMQLPPRKMTDSFLSWRELSVSIWQGLAITAGTLFTYQISVGQGCDESQTRTLVFLCLVTSNIFLTLVNRSFLLSMIETLSYRNMLMRVILALTVAMTVLLISVPAFADFFGFDWPGWPLAGSAMLTGMIGVVWFEGYKWWRRRREMTIRS
jgi:P-type Ca2+ transporter type 2C